MAKRLQSPSSINTFKQCPRKYFYQYVLKYPVKENIHCLRGNIVHETLEKFFDIDVDTISEECFKKEISFYIKNLFDACWGGASARLRKFNLSEEQISFFYDESTHMLATWLNHFFDDAEKEMRKSGLSFQEAFRKLRPAETERHFKDTSLMVGGFVDAIHKDGEDVLLIDYKTSKTDELKDEYLLQLGIYSVLYEKENGKFPTKVGLWFLKHKLLTIDVTPEMIKNALFEIEQIHFATASDKICDYPKKESGLCRWSGGQCDFLDICQKNR